MMGTILHVELRDTDLSDFIDHFEQDLKMGLAIQLLRAEGFYRILGPDMPMDFSHPDLEGYVETREIVTGQTKRSYRLSLWSQEDIGSVHLFLTVARYVRGRLKLTLTQLDDEDGPQDPEPYNAQLLNWLRPRWGDALEVLDQADAPTAPVAENETRSKSPREYMQISATIAEYLINRKVSQRNACALAQIDPKTYRNYRDQGWLLSEEDFKKTVVSGKSIAEEAEDYK